MYFLLTSFYALTQKFSLHAAPTDRPGNSGLSTSTSAPAPGRNNIVNCPQCLPTQRITTNTTTSASCVQCINSPRGICAQCAASPQPSHFQHNSASSNAARVSQQECNINKLYTSLLILDTHHNHYIFQKLLKNK